MKKILPFIFIFVLAGCQHVTKTPDTGSNTAPTIDATTAIAATKVALPKIYEKLSILHTDSSKFCNIDSLTAALELVEGVTVVSYDSASSTVYAEIGKDGPLIGVAAKPRPCIKDTVWGVIPDSQTLSKKLGNIAPTGGNVRLLYGLNSDAYPNWTYGLATIITNSKRNYTVKVAEATLGGLSQVGGDDVVVM